MVMVFKNVPTWVPYANPPPLKKLYLLIGEFQKPGNQGTVRGFVERGRQEEGRSGSQGREVEGFGL